MSNLKVLREVTVKITHNDWNDIDMFSHEVTWALGKLAEDKEGLMAERSFLTPKGCSVEFVAGTSYEPSQNLIEEA